MGRPAARTQFHEGRKTYRLDKKLQKLLKDSGLEGTCPIPLCLFAGQAELRETTSLSIWLLDNREDGRWVFGKMLQARYLCQIG